MSVPDNLKAIEKKVSDNPDLEQSAVALAQGVADELDKLTQDPVAIRALATELRNHAPALGAAVLHNTPHGGPAGTIPGTATTPTGGPAATKTPAPAAPTKTK